MLNQNQENYSSLYKNDEFIKTIDEGARVVRNKISFISYKKKKKILDVACGVSMLSKTFGDNTYGLDINKEAVLFGRKHSIKVKKGFVDKKWNFPDNSFDVVIASQIIEHLIDTDILLTEAWRVLKKNGTLIVVTPNLASWFNRVLLLFGYQPFFTEVSTIDKTLGLKFTRQLTSVRKPLGHLRVFTSVALKDLFELHRFSEIKSLGTEFVFFPWYIRTIDKIFSYIPSLASNLIVVGKKAGNRS